MSDQTQETPLQAAMREAGVDTVEQLQKVQAAKRSGEVPAPDVTTEEAPKPARAKREPKAQKTDIFQDGSTLAQAAAVEGVSTLEDLQAKQAAARVAASALPEALSTDVVPAPLDELGLKELADEIRKAEAEAEGLSAKVAKATARVNEIRQHVDSLRARMAAALYVPNTVANQEYLEASKRAMQDRFKLAQAAKSKLDELDPQLQMDKDALGLGRSPLDRAISGQLSAKRRAESAAALQAAKQQKR